MKMRKPGYGRVFLSCGRRGVMRPSGRGKTLLGGLFLLLLLVPVLVSAPAAVAATAAQQTQKGKALHGQPWAFGQSEDRKAAIWRRGVPAQSLKQKALTGAAAKAQAGNAPAAKMGAGQGSSKNAAAGKKAPVQGATQKSGAQNGAPGHGAMDTGSGIDRALAAAQAIADAEAEEAAKGQHAKPKGSLGMSMKNSTTTWNVTPMREAMRPDEVLVRDRHHVLRAFADVEPTEDLSIRVGPELILKDEQHGAESAGSSQPDSALGLGMQFKLDF